MRKVEAKVNRVPIRKRGLRHSEELPRGSHDLGGNEEVMLSTALSHIDFQAGRLEAG